MVICTVPACYQAVPEHQGQDVLRWAGGAHLENSPPALRDAHAGVGNTNLAPALPLLLHPALAIPSCP